MKDPMFKINLNASASGEEHAETDLCDAGTFQVFRASTEDDHADCAGAQDADGIDESEIDFIIQIVKQALSEVDFDEANPVSDFKRNQRIQAAKRVLH